MLSRGNFLANIEKKENKENSKSSTLNIIKHLPSRSIKLHNQVNILNINIPL